MFIIIVGGGKVGTYLARALLKRDHEIVVIEKDARKAQMMTNALETDVAIVGDGCDPTVLQSAGISRSDIVVADTGDDEDNLVVCLIARKHSHARCIARVNNPKNKLIFDSLDSGTPITVISSTELILDHIEDQVDAEALDFESCAKLGKGDLELVEVAIRKHSPAEGQRVADLALPTGCIVIAIERGGGEVVIPNGETTLHEGERVIAMVKRSARPDVRTALVG
jgi:trk system potassium uptake protein TrkA